ncbi:spore germination protein [Paenibacillus sp. FSL R7-277]|uniref:GerAB/ArcD/ProY family transporter n=1 Tax=unclassified Paenibacillus TaxID=185978 RepID=UPI0003E294F5|nr:endospore germination permease [Paenibacillus sp. FSL R7-277]ETT72306.1 spore germination protein [Paenibacillus sp. FSL R7-277]
MSKSKKLSSVQFFILTFGLATGTSILDLPGSIALVAREDAWIAALISLLINLLMAGLCLALSRLYPGQNLFEILESVLGRWPGKAFSLIYLFYFLTLTSTLLGDMGTFITTEVMPETPQEAIKLIFLLVIVIGARKGIIILARLGELLFPWLLLLLMLLILALIPQVTWTHILPVMEDGAGPSLSAGIQSSMFQEPIVLMGFLPLVKLPGKQARALLGGMTAGGLILFVLVLLSVMVLGIEQTSNSIYPVFVLAKTINIGNVLQRVEGVLITIWIMTFFIKISLLFLLLLQNLQTVFRLKRTSHLIYPLAVLLFVLASNVYINIVYVLDIAQNVWWKFAAIHLVFVPLVVYLIALIRQKLGTSAARS